AGLLGGLAASWVMSRFQAAVPADTFKELLGEPTDDDGSDESEPATVKAAEAVSEGFLGHRLSEDEKAWAGPAMHYAHGSLSAALYGALAEHQPIVTRG